MDNNRLKIQVLREDKEEMMGTFSAVKQDLSVAHQQLRQLASTALKVRDDRESQVKQLYDRCVAAESHARVIEAIAAEHDQVVSHVRSVTETNLQLAAEYRSLHSDLDRIKVEAADVSHLKSDLQTMRLELLKGRAAIEFEKKTRAANLEQYQAMERNMISMKNDMERLRDELAHAEKRARAAAAATSNPDNGYLENHRGPPDMVRQGGHSTHYPMHQTTNPDESAYPAVYRPPNGGHDPFDMHSDSFTKRMSSE